MAEREFSDADREAAFAWAQERIAVAKAEGSPELRLNSQEGRALDRLPDEIGDLTQLSILNVQNTQVSDLRALEELSGLQELSLINTPVSDLRALAGLSGLQVLNLRNTQVSDLLPLVGLSKLAGEGVNALLDIGLSFTGTPAAELDDAHRALAAIVSNRDRAKQVLQYT